MLVYTSLGNGETAKAVCGAIERMSGSTDVDAALTPGSFGARTSSKRRVGCVNNADYPGGMYQAYAPI